MILMAFMMGCLFQPLDSETRRQLDYEISHADNANFPQQVHGQTQALIKTSSDSVDHTSAMEGDHSLRTNNEAVRFQTEDNHGEGEIVFERTGSHCFHHTKDCCHVYQLCLTRPKHSTLLDVEWQIFFL